jgi:TolB-like protein
MSRSDAERVAELLEQTLEMTHVDRREFLAWLRAEDADLAGEVQSLLAAYEEAPHRLDSLAAQVMPRALDDLSRALDTDSALPAHVGRYRILARLGRGGMGEVCLAHDPELDRQVALKLLPPHLAADPEARARLKTEARAASALDHPNIAVVHEIGVTEPASVSPEPERLYVVMAHYSGETLKQKFVCGPLPIEEGLDYAIQIAEGLAAAHEAGILHRDIKPANVIVTDRGQVKILDFGLAKLAGADVTRDGTTLGTVAYMSPEQTRGGPIDARSDLWSLGVLLYEMLAGVRPFRGESDATLIHAVRHDVPEPVEALRPEVPAALAAIIRTCLEKNAADRYRRAEDLLPELKAVAAGAVKAVRERRPAAAARGWPAGAQRGPTIRLGLALVLLVLAVPALLILRGGGSGAATDVGAAGAEVLNPSAIMVLPFAPAAPDSALARLGRDLVVTISASLDGIEDLRTVDPLTVLAQPVPASGAFSVAEGVALARRLGVGRLLHGALIRAGDEVRLEATLYGARDATPVARVSVTEDAQDLHALTDAATLALLRRLWREAPPAAPSIGAITTTSVPALRAYLEGEQALARGDFPHALESFERAYAADSTFWYSYLRSLYPRAFREASAPADTAVLRRIFEHRAELPEADRLLVESWRAPTATERIEQLEALAERFIYHSPGWWAYGDILVHHGPYLGTTLEDARSALERVVALVPDFAAGWDHLVWVTISLGDTAAALRAAQEATRTFGSATQRAALWVRVLQLRARVLHSGLPEADSLERLADFILAAPPILAVNVASGLVADGAPAAQLGLNRALRARQPVHEVAVALQRGEALAWAARGAWDSALVAADRWARMSDEPDAVLGAYRLALAGVTVGAIPPAEAARRRPAGAAGAVSTVEGAEELVWLDGVLAYLQGDRERIAAALRAFPENPGPRSSLLRRSLAALALDAAGERERATREMFDLEREIADSRDLADQVAERGLPHRIELHHPLLVTLNRLICIRWLRALGRDAEAARLLTWHEAMPGSPLTQAWQRGIGALSLLERAEIAEAMGQPEQARRYYARLLAQYDLPVPALQPRMARAEAALARLAAGPAR